MKSLNYILLLFFLLKIFVTLNLNAQENTGIKPYSFYSSPNTEKDYHHIKLAPPDIDRILKEDIETEKNGEMMRIARLIPLEINLKNSGTWEVLENGIRYWTLRISSENAKASALHFERFKIPDGASFFVYDVDTNLVLGPYTNSYNELEKEFTVGIMYGGDLILEYYPPQNYESIIYPDFQLQSFSYIYREIDFLSVSKSSKNTGYGASDDCQVNINCSEGNNWRTHQRGVARIYVVDGWSAGFCTGSLINNTAQDGEPYFLTADHCGGDVSASNMNQWLFWFNYEAPSCSYNTSSMPEPSRDQIQGCSKISQGLLDGGSDFLLLKLNTTPTSLKNINAVYNGWRSTGASTSSGVSIHHPSGDIKKISTFTGTLGSATYNGQDETGATNAHWRVYWSSTSNGHGVTEGGSSGSPLFDSQGFIIGTLSGGSSYCDQTSFPDLYGKMSYHWESNGSNNNQKLKPWLDPENSGETSISYFDPNNVGFMADFVGNPTNVEIGGSVSFTDQSSSAANSWSWSFPGGNPATASNQNPTVTYNNPGTYSVTLTSGNGVDFDTKTRTNYIVVSDNPCGGFTNYPFNEVFNSASMPDCWEVQTQNSSETWNLTQSYSIGDVQINPQSGSHFYSCYWDVQDQDEWLITRSFDFTNLTSPEISFYFNGSYFWSVADNDNCDLDLMVSVNNGSWTKIWNEANNSSFSDETSYQWLYTILNISDYQGNSNVRFAFRYSGNDGAAFAVDNVRINGELAEVYTLSVNVQGQGFVNVNGTLYSSTLSFVPGAQVSLLANPSSGWIFNNWSGALSGSSNPINLNMNSNKTVTAVFNDNIFVDESDKIDELSVFPNPSTGLVNIYIPDNNDAKVQLLDLLGNNLNSFDIYRDNPEIDLSSYPAGVYLLKIEYNNILDYKKIVLK